VGRGCQFKIASARTMSKMPGKHRLLRCVPCRRRLGHGGPRRVGPFPLCFPHFFVPSASGPRWPRPLKIIKLRCARRPPRFLVAGWPHLLRFTGFPHPLRIPLCAWATVAQAPQLKMYYNTREVTSAAQPCRNWTKSPWAALRRTLLRPWRRFYALRPRILRARPP